MTKRNRRALATALGAGAASLAAPQLASAAPGCESMQKGAAQKIEVCIFYTDKDWKISNARFEVRNGSGGGGVVLTPIARWSIGARDPIQERRFSGKATLVGLNTSRTQAPVLCGAYSGMAITNPRLVTPCGSFWNPGGHITFEAVRYNSKWNEIDRLTHK